MISCVSKLFSSILVNRISLWAEDNSIICEEQFGFRKGRRTTDAVFVLNSLIQKHILKRKKLPCCFVDLKKAFDSIPINKLWDRLLKLNLNPQIIQLLQSKYSKTRSCIQTNNGYTKFFPVSRGLQQGCNLSPLLFNLYINELPRLLKRTTLLNQSTSCLLFADDIVMFSDNPHDLQESLNLLQNFCSSSSLNININKTKVVVFGENPKHIKFEWTINEETLEISDCYKYLGTWLHWRGNYTYSLTKLSDYANKTLQFLQQNIIKLGITDINIHMKLFNTLVKPILLYNAEIWGLHDVKCLERICLKFYKFSLKISQTSSTTAIYSELGLLPISYDINLAVAKYYERARNQMNSNLLTDALSLSTKLAHEDLHSWSYFLSNHMKTLGFNITFNQPTIYQIKERSQEQHLQNINYQLNNPQGISGKGGNKLRYYRLLKQPLHNMEKYLTVIKDPMLRQAMTRLRISNHTLLIESGRHTHPPTPPEERLCTLCNLKDVEDEPHFLIACPRFSHLRHNMLATANATNSCFRYLSSKDTSTYILTSTNENLIWHSAKYIYNAMKLRSALLSPPV